MAFIKIETRDYDTKVNTERLVNLNQITQILYNKKDLKLSFNFTSLVEKTNETGKLLPAFHYIEYADKESIDTTYQECIERFKNHKIPIYTFSGKKYDRIINFNNINSIFFNKSLKNSILTFINFSTSITSQNGWNSLVEHAIKLNLDEETYKDFSNFLDCINLYM